MIVVRAYIVVEVDLQTVNKQKKWLWVRDTAGSKEARKKKTEKMVVVVTPSVHKTRVISYLPLYFA